MNIKMRRLGKKVSPRHIFMMKQMHPLATLGAEGAAAICSAVLFKVSIGTIKSPWLSQRRPKTRIAQQYQQPNDDGENQQTIILSTIFFRQPSLQ